MPETYIHGFSDDEQRRLTLMQSILNEAELAAFDLAGARRILDVGAGLGQFTRALARAAGPGAEVLGIEKDERQLAEAKRQATDAGEADLAELRRGNADALPLRDDERGNFDLAHARFLLEHVSNPLDVVREMVRAVRPGGRVVLVDDDHDLLRLNPSCARFERAWQLYWETYRDHDHDPLIGRRLPELLHQAGATPTRITMVFYGAVQGTALFDPVIDNLIGVVGGAEDELDRDGRVPRAELQRALSDLDAWRRLTAATLWYSLPLAEGVRP